MRYAAFTACFLLLFTVHAAAQVQVERKGEENPAVTISKSILWGGLAGLVLGGATALAVEKNEAEIVKWFSVGGVFGGLAVGVYHVATRPAPTVGLVQKDGDRLTVHVPSITVFQAGDDMRPRRGVHVTLFATSF